jgi:hypothetical protein
MQLINNNTTTNLISLLKDLAGNTLDEISVIKIKEPTTKQVLLLSGLAILLVTVLTHLVTVGILAGAVAFLHYLTTGKLDTAIDTTRTFVTKTRTQLTKLATKAKPYLETAVTKATGLVNKLTNKEQTAPINPFTLLDNEEVEDETDSDTPVITPVNPVAKVEVALTGLLTIEGLLLETPGIDLTDEQVEELVRERNFYLEGWADYLAKVKSKLGTGVTDAEVIAEYVEEKNNLLRVSRDSYLDETANA